MTRDTVTVEQLTGIRNRLFSAILPWLTNADREFLIAFKRGEPRWEHLGIAHARALPAVRWKQHNLDRMSPQARRAAIRRLEMVLAL